MCKDDDLVRIRHMLDAALKLIDFTKSCKRSDLDEDEKLSLSVVRLIEILGEAAKYVSESCRQQHPDIPWRDIAGTRDRLIHGYFDVDFNIVWQIVSVDLLTLVPQLENILNK